MNTFNEAPGASRRELHRRQVDSRFYERSDGLYEVEASLVDTKSEPFLGLLATAPIAPGDALHDIVVTLMLDEAMVVLQARLEMRSTPFKRCGGVVDTMAPLRGLQIGTGWNRQVRERLGGSASCAHVVELLSQMATTAYQGLSARRMPRMHLPESEPLRRARVDSCYAFAANGEVVGALWPDLARSEPPEGRG
jgi:hypothetical protein